MPTLADAHLSRSAQSSYYRYVKTGGMGLRIDEGRHMELSEVLHEDIISLDVKGTTKDEVLHELAQLLLDGGYISDIDQFVKDIYVRESMGITGAGNHVAIPHGKSGAVLQNTIAIGRSDHMVEWESYDDEPVNLFFLFCVSERQGLRADPPAPARPARRQDRQRGARREAAARRDQARHHFDSYGRVGELAAR